MQMEICSRIGFPVSDVNSLHVFCTKILNIQVDVERVSASIKKDVIQMKNECLKSHQSEIISEAHDNDDDDVFTSEVIADDDSDCATSVNVNPHCSSAPERSKPVSAMKGSREKHGLRPPKQLTVKWAPDVYDPVPASALQILINRPHKHGKKKSKSKPKNTSKSRGSKSKDKKQARVKA